LRKQADDLWNSQYGDRADGGDAADSNGNADRGEIAG
jgi:hypothetical protein